MRPDPNRGRVYRRCGCRDEHGRQLGARCLQLANPRHGTWAFAVGMPSPDRKRKTLRRSGFSTRSDARAALARVLECERAGVYLDDAQTVADYLVGWLEAKARRLKPTTVARYRDYLHNDLLPAFGAVRLERLTHQHVDQFVRAQLAAGRGSVTVRRCIATLSSALNDAIRQRRLTHNAARYTSIPTPHRVERPCWTIAEAVVFLRYCRQIDDPLAELFELLICTGMRKGEALGLHWVDVNLDAKLLFVRHTLVAVDNSRLMFNTPKTISSRDWIALSARAVNSLRRRARRHRAEALTGPAYHDQGLVFCRPDGQPLRPERVLRRFYDLTDAAGVPRIRVHDLRHLAATIMIASGVPLAMVSKTLRHSTLSTTVDIYGHLTRQAAQDAVDATATALDIAERNAKRTPVNKALACDHNATTSRLN
jgi:integrase